MEGGSWVDQIEWIAALLTVSSTHRLGMEAWATDV